MVQSHWFEEERLHSDQSMHFDVRISWDMSAFDTFIDASEQPESR
jgi:hypothetical protein